LSSQHAVGYEMCSIIVHWLHACMNEFTLSCEAIRGQVCSDN